MKTVSQLLESIELEELDVNLYRGKNHDVGSPNVFGGQVLSQAIDAAYKNIPQDRFLHSIHSYFILPGNLEKPIIYNVEVIRNGGSFSTRRVTASQNGKVIFILAASFQLQQPGFEHQVEMPKTKHHSKLFIDLETFNKFKALAPKSIKRFLIDRPIDYKPIDPFKFLKPSEQVAKNYTWMRTKGKLPDDLRIHQRLLAYASDYNLLITATLPHQKHTHFSKLQMASLDHAMWFYKPFKFDDWMLYETESPTAVNSRGFTRGNFFTEDGTLVASCTQEGLMRKKRKK